MSLPTIARLILTALLLVGVYTETGKWTTLMLALGALAHEMMPLYRGPK